MDQLQAETAANGAASALGFGGKRRLQRRFALTSENAILSLAVLLSTFPVQAQVIHTVAGGGPLNGIVATSASIAGYSPAVDTNGNVYFSSGEAVYKLDTTDHLTLVAGQNIAGVFALGAIGNACPTAANIGDGGPATSALLNNPRAVAVDGAGNLYIADSFSCRVRVVNMQSSTITVLGVTIAAGNIATVAGSATYGSGGDNGPATSAQLYQPTGVAVDSNGNLYIADTGNSRVRMVNTSGTITAFAGNGTRGCIGDSTAATGAELNSPVGLAADAAGNIYIADDGGCNIRAVNTQTGSITVLGVTVAPKAIASVAGDGVQGYNSDGIAATSAEINLPRGVALDSSGNLYIADTGNARIREVSTSGTITTIAGNGTAGYSGDSGPATSAEIAGPYGIALDASRDLYIADQNNSQGVSDYRIRKVTAGTISTVAGNGNAGFSGDGQIATGAQLNNPSDVATDAAGNLYIADSFNNVVRVVNTQSSTITVLGVTIPAGDVATVAGNESLHNCSFTTNQCFGGDGGPATSAELNLPEGVAVDGAGNLYIADSGNARVREVNLNGIISTLAGSDLIGDQNGPATGAALNFPVAVAVDLSGSVYIADLYGNVVREVNTGPFAIATFGGAMIPPGYIATVAGNGTGGYNGDGISALNAELNGPTGIALDPNYNLYIADSSNARLREVEVVSGTIITVAGNGTAGYSGDGGAATSAELAGPYGVTSDLFGNLYIADYSGIRVVNTQSSSISALGVTIGPGDIATVAGNGTLGFSGDGGLATSAMIDGVQGTALDLSQNLYIADFENLRIRKVNALQNPTAPNFTLTTTTPIQTVAQGGDSATYVVTITAVNGFSGTVSINAIIDPYMGYERPATVTIAPDGSQNFNFVIVSKLSPSGTFPVTVVGTTASGLVSTLPLQLIVEKPALTPTVTVTPSPSSITTSQADTVTVTVSGGSGNPVATGSVTLTSGTYTSSAATLSGGSAMINIPAGSLAVGMDTLTANYSPDSPGAIIYANTMGTNTVTVAASGVSFVSNVGTAEAAQAVTVNITTAGTLNSIQVLTQGAPGLDFTETSGGTCKTTTAYTVGQTCTVNVIFKPQYSGARWGAVVLTNSSGVVLGTTYLPGTGVGPQLAIVAGDFQTVNFVGYSPGILHGEAADGIAVDASGDIYIANFVDVTEIPAGCTTTSCYVTMSGGNLTQPEGVAIDGSGNLYVSNAGSPGSVVELPLGCTSSSCAIVLGGGWANPREVAVDGTGNVYVADTGNNAVKEMPQGCLSSSCVTTLGGGFNATQAVAVDGKGNVFVADENLSTLVGSIKEMPAGCSSSSCVTTLLANLPPVQGVAVDAAGDVYFFQAVPSDNGVFEMEAVGGSIPASPTVIPLITDTSSLHPTGNVNGIALDGAGDVYFGFASVLLELDVLELPSSAQSELGFEFPQLNRRIDRHHRRPA